MRDIAVTIHFIGLAMGIGTSIGFMIIGIASSKMPKEEGTRFYVNSLVLGRMGQIGLALLILSGLYLTEGFWDALLENNYFIAKLVLVAVLAVLISIITINTNKAKMENPEKYLTKARPFGMLALLVGIAIIVLAVEVFH